MTLCRVPWHRLGWRSCQPRVDGRQEQVCRDLLEYWAMRLVSGGVVLHGSLSLVEEIRCMGADAS